MADRVEELKELIAGVDLSDPFARVDHGRWQAELARLLKKRGKRATRTVSNPISVATPDTKPQVLSRGGVGYRQIARTVATRQSKERRTNKNTSAKRLTRKEIEIQILKRPPRSGAATELSLPLPKPNPGTLGWCKHQWFPALRACKLQISLLANSPTPTTQKKQKTRDPNQYVRGLHEILSGLINIMLSASDASQFIKAQKNLLSYRKAHPPLQAVPIPNPLPNPPSSPPLNQRGSQTRMSSGSGGSSPGRPSSTGGRSDGEAFGSYNRLSDLGRGRSFEESVAIQQSSRQDRRALVDRADRISSSGSREEYEDLD